MNKSTNQITFLMPEDEGFRQRSREFLKTLLDSYPGIEYREEAAPRGGLRLGDGLFYFGIPEDKELTPFLTFIQGRLQPEDYFSLNEIEALKKLGQPVSVKLFVSPTCPHCPHLASRLYLIHAFNRGIRIFLYDVVTCERDAEEYSVHSVPALIVNERIKLTGNLESSLLLRALQGANLNPELLLLRRMVDQGNAIFLAHAMIKDGSIYPSFLDLITAEEWSVRVGAMVTMETLINEAPKLAKKVIEPLKKKYDSTHPSARGDILYIFSETADSTLIPWLKEKLSSESHPEVISVIEETILELEAR